MRTNWRVIGVVLVALGLSVGSASAAPDSGAKPNIIVILVDDMGFSDLGCYGSEIPTPNIDRLADEGLRFRQFYNTGRCCPSRAAILTGLYSHQAGIGLMNEDQGLSGYRGYLNDTCVTIAEVLKPAGYFTAMVGKWHVGQPKGVTPVTRGFDASFNAPAGGFYWPEDQRTNQGLFLNGKRVAVDGPELPKKWYSTDLWTDFAIKFIDQGLAEKKPFFLYLAHNAPHFPLEAPAEDVAFFKGKYATGWDALREARYQKQTKSGLIDPKITPLTARPAEVPAWDTLGPKQKERYATMMEVYAACVRRLDTNIGRLMDELKARGVYDNTVVLFMSDNGGNAEGGIRGTMQTPNGPGGPQSTLTYGQCWGTLSNTPFQWYKHYNYEGGIATPLIVHWPAKIAQGSGFRDQVGHFIDVLPTCADLAGATYPKQFNGKAITPVEGISLVPAFADSPLPREAVFWEHEGNAAVRVGDWKLDRLGPDGQWRLFDLATDRSEMKDLTDQQPDRAAELKKRWNAWAERANVLPAPPRGAKKNGD